MDLSNVITDEELQEWEELRVFSEYLTELEK
jgi:hypothetical protein